MFIFQLKWVLKIVCFSLLAYLAKLSVKMPLSKATKYKRFNVGTYMKEMRIASQDIEATNKTLGAKRKQLNRIEEKVRKHILSLQLFKNITMRFVAKLSMKSTWLLS